VIFDFVRPEETAGREKHEQKRTDWKNTANH
jgi:hypothetical protein